MIWRSAIIAGYLALAIVIGVAHGARGLAILFFFYFWAAAWFVFVLVWGWAARAAGRWSCERLDREPVGRERNRSRPGDGEAEASEHHPVSVERDSLPAPAANRRKPAPAV